MEGLQKLLWGKSKEIFDAELWGISETLWIALRETTPRRVPRVTIARASQAIQKLQVFTSITGQADLLPPHPASANQKYSCDLRPGLGLHLLTPSYCVKASATSKSHLRESIHAHFQRSASRFFMTRYQVLSSRLVVWNMLLSYML